MYLPIIFTLKKHLAYVIKIKNQVVYVHIVLTFSHIFPFHVMAPGTEKELGGNKSCISRSSNSNRHQVQADA